MSRPSSPPSPEIPRKVRGMEVTEFAQRMMDEAERMQHRAEALDHSDMYFHSLMGQVEGIYRTLYELVTTMPIYLDPKVASVLSLWVKKGGDHDPRSSVPAASGLVP